MPFTHCFIFTCTSVTSVKNRRSFSYQIFVLFLYCLSFLGRPLILFTVPSYWFRYYCREGWTSNEKVSK
jgi:hypothetical protein